MIISYDKIIFLRFDFSCFLSQLTSFVISTAAGKQHVSETIIKDKLKVRF